MNTSLTIRHQAKYVSLSRAAGALVSVVGGLVILGWLMDVPWLKSISPDWATMKVNAAGCFVLCGCSLVLQGYEQSGLARRRVARACAAIVLLVALLTLAEYLTQANFGLDELLLKQTPGATEAAHPGRMSLASVVGFIGISLALLGLDWKTRNGIRPAQALAMLAGLIGQFAFAGYIFGVESPFAHSPFSEMAIHTTVLFLVLSLGVLVARPGAGFLGTLTSEGIGGVLARRLLPLAVILPLGIGWLRLQGQLAGYYGLEFGLALFATSNIFAFFSLIWCAAYWLNRAEAERKIAEQEVRESQRQLKSIIDSAMDAIITVDEAQNVILFNNAAEKMFGCAGREALGQPLERFIPARFRQAHARHIQTFGQTGETGRAMGKLGDIHGLRANGEEFPIEASISSTTSGNKQLFTVILRDITLRKRDEEARARLAAIVEHSDDAIIGKNLDGIITSWNRAAEQLLGYTAAEIIGQPVTRLIPPERQDEEKAILARLKRGEHIRHYETVRRRKDGSLVELSLTISPLLDGHGRVVGASKIARDITERKRVEAGLKLFRALVDKSNDAIFVVDPETGRLLDVNEKNCVSLGYTREEMLALSVFDLDATVARADWPRLQAELRQAGSVSVEGRQIRKDGATFPVEVNIKYVQLDRGYVIAIARDITERKRVEQELRESHERFREIAENINEVFWVVSPHKSQMLYISPAYEKIWGRTCASLYNSPGNWLASIHPEDRARIAEAAQIKQIQKTYDEVYRITRPNGEVRWIHDVAFPLRDAAGAVYRIVGVAEDITEQKKLEQQYRQAQKMEAIGTLAGGIAHDFNNILAAVNGYAELARMKAGNDPHLRDYLDAITHAGQRATGLVRQILTFSRQQEQAERQAAQLGEIVEESLKLLRASIPATIEFSIHLDRAARPVLADANQIHQVIMNLGTNAWHAMRDRPGRLEVTLVNLDVDESLVRMHPRLRPGPYVKLSMSDTGCGMDAATMERIFEPFFTTKPVGEGTGLGLSVVHGIMNSHDGLITVYSHPGQGTVFHLYFPAHHESVKSAAAPAAPPPQGHGKRVLYVDDEPALTQLGQQTLEQLGYTVTSTIKVAEALELVRADPQLFDLVITDQTMPGMTGVDFAAQLLKIRPGLPIILTTGYSPYLTVERVRAMGIRDLLLKPHTLYTLGMAVSRALAEKKPE